MARFGSSARFDEFEAKERAINAELSAVQFRMSQAMAANNHHLLNQLRARCDELNASRYALDTAYPDVCNRVRVNNA